MLFNKSNKEMIAKMQENNQILADTLTQITQSNSQQNKEMMLKMQENNQLLADTLAEMVEKKKQKEEKNVEPWTAAYALNLCTVSVSQIIEYNDLRFMEQEYENILNNLNLEMMPKDEALLDILKQILDVINFFKIQSKDKELLEKEYQQKLKDAVWSAVPSPSVILSGGAGGGFVGMAISAAVTAGTAYMNYRKEKAKINNEQERKEWELERSAMEQLHGLQRQLFETAWRLADEYGFGDEKRLTERQIKQYNEILADPDSLRRYERLEYISDKFEAYPPFWYYMGSAALHYAKEMEEDNYVCREYLLRAYKCFNDFYEKSKKEQKLLREDPIVAQCTFEYIATLNMIEEHSFLPVDDEKIRKDVMDKRIEKIDEACASAGSSLDILQQCAMNYLALGSTEKAIKIMNALINEQYNVTLNAQFLSVLYVKQNMKGILNAKYKYDELKKKGIGDAVLYPMISDKSEEKSADKEFLIKSKISLAERYCQIMREYSDEAREEFSEIWNQNYDITDDVIEFFNKMAQDISDMCLGSSYEMISGKIKEKVGKSGISEALNSKEKREDDYSSLVVESVLEAVVKEIAETIDSARNVEELSKEETKVMAFCEKQNIILKAKRVGSAEKKKLSSLEKALLGEKVDQFNSKREMRQKYAAVVEDPQNKENIIAKVKKADFITYSNKSALKSYIKEINYAVPTIEGDVVAVLMYKVRSGKHDIVFTTNGLYILETKSYKNEGVIRYTDVARYVDGSAIVKASDTKNKIYKHSAVNYPQFFEMISQLAEIENDFMGKNNANLNVDINKELAQKIIEWKRELLF